MTKKQSKPKYRYTREQKAAALTAANKIMNGFRWAATPEGGDYWNEVYINLTRIAGRRP